MAGAHNHQTNDCICLYVPRPYTRYLLVETIRVGWPLWPWISMCFHLTQLKSRFACGAKITFFHHELVGWLYLAISASKFALISLTCDISESQKAISKQAAESGQLFHSRSAPYRHHRRDEPYLLIAPWFHARGFDYGPCECCETPSSVQAEIHREGESSSRWEVLDACCLNHLDEVWSRRVHWNNFDVFSFVCPRPECGSVLLTWHAPRGSEIDHHLPISSSQVAPFVQQSTDHSAFRCVCLLVEVLRVLWEQSRTERMREWTVIKQTWTARRTTAKSGE